MKKEVIEKFIEGKKAVEIEYEIECKKVRYICEKPKVSKRWGVSVLVDDEGISIVAISDITGLREWAPKGDWVRKGEPDVYL